MSVTASMLAGCSASTSSTQTPPSPAPVRQSPAVSPIVTPTATAVVGLASCPATVSFSSLTTLAHVSGADDLAAAPDGTLWISDPNGGRLVHLDSSGRVLATISDPRTPEGIVVLGTDQLALAEQGPDRIVLLQPSTQRETTLLQLSPRSGAMGLDGIAAGTVAGTLLVPDSPNGTLLSVTLGGVVRTLASGLGRPVAAASIGGVIVVTAENSTGLFAVPAAGGSATPLSGVSDADDAVASGSLVYVTSLGTRQLLAVDPVTGQSRVLVSGIDMPQGAALLPDGRLAVADSTTGTVAVLSAC